MILFPNCKINLGLYVTEKRSDGYHNLETVFYPVPLEDALEIVPADNAKTTLSVSGMTISDDPEKNLVMRAFRLLEHDFQLPAVHIFLHKNIPFGAGLGGGSSDAAFALKLLNELFSLKLDTITLQKYAVKLGADCPFFIQNQPMVATGIGEILHPADLSLKGYWMVIVKPPCSVSTQEAYSGVVPQHPKMTMQQQISKPITEWKKLIFNDFEKHIFQKYPLIADIKQTMYAQQALYASMSGSGSSVYGIFEKEPLLSFPENYFVFTTQL
ncbi:MAG: 4-(cytidine 5'-diphospho)-2-C-methyl-D-erythritol kinase [Bacteroidales bacterium]|nr:4-(cytidine 5'-diphospho)-2-C-methyl-D-erythritol kinase [Bacteroidales bacterium]